MTFLLSILVSVLHFKDYILFIKIAVLTAAPGRAVMAEPGAGSCRQARGCCAPPGGPGFITTVEN